MKTQYLAEATRHSNPSLQAKLYEYEMLLRNNATIKGVHGDHVHLSDGRTVGLSDLHGAEEDGGHKHSDLPAVFLKDYIIRRLGKVVSRELQACRDLIDSSNGKSAELPVGSVINAATMIVP